EVDRAVDGRDGGGDAGRDAVGGGGDGVQGVGRFRCTRGHDGDDLDFRDGVRGGRDRVQFRRGTRGARCGDTDLFAFGDGRCRADDVVDDAGGVINRVNDDRRATLTVATKGA